MVEQSPDLASSDTEFEEPDASIGVPDEDISLWPITQEVNKLLELNERNGSKLRKLGVTWSDLTVKGVSNDAVFNENVLSQFNPIGKSTEDIPLKTIIQSSYGCVKPGEMLLVLGNPGAGCTTLLNILSNRRLGYAEISGNVSFGSMSSEEAKDYRGQIVLNAEEEIFFPTLSVGNTLDFATRLNVPSQLSPSIGSPEEYARTYKQFLLKSLAMEHTHDSKVGDAYVRGVSGGERKRVSILECLATRGSIFCWDNSTRGLDASTALDWAKTMRVMTDKLGLTTIATLYQAGNAVFEQFDKVLILDNGKQILYGPREEAVPFMEGLGFLCDPAANKADFLTSVTVPKARAIIEGYENKIPRTNDEILGLFQKSSLYERMKTELNYHQGEEATTNTTLFKEEVAREKHKLLPNKPTVTANFYVQVKTAITRQYQIVWSDKATFIVKQASTVVQALVAGSLFYQAPDHSAGLFLKGGAIFFALLYPAYMAMSEVTDSFTGRPVLAKHRSFALHYPAAWVLAQIAADIPVALFQWSHFGIVLYFMVGLKTTAAAFFTFWVIVFSSAMAMTALYRAIGAAFPTFDAATKVSGLITSAFFIYMGYMIGKPEMKDWFVWIFWINPMSYGYEALLGNEVKNAEFPCVGPNLVPVGPQYDRSEGGQACAGIGGARPGATSVSGEQYLGSLSFHTANVWRNFGILWVWWFLFVAITIVFTSRWKEIGEGGRGILVPRETQRKALKAMSNDEESQAVEKPPSGLESSQPTEQPEPENLIRNTSIFTWKNLTYTIKTPSGDRTLLDNIQGYVKPGMLGALMGSSGAGKTTLLDVLAQRKTEGTIRGSVLVDGRPLPVSFQRSAGYVEQMDVHESLATVREALEFSALLRQSRKTPREEKLRYVDTIIDLLQLQDIQHTLIGSPGAGLTIEQRKRLTIGVELVAKPSILIFLDEPTSGLDGQAAYSTVRFLRKLADVGQAILVTIHQPSAQLFSQFDTLLLLAKGGKTVYFGDIGSNADTVKTYFKERGAPCPPNANPAEHMIEVVSGDMSGGKDWAQIWLDSQQCKNLSQEIDALVADAAAKPPGTVDDGYAFASPMWMQTKLVTQRMNVSLYRNTEYVNNKVIMHILLALLNGFSFWMIGDSLGDLKLRLFTVFSFIFVAPGTISQLQPLFINRRDIYETREKKSKTYHWAPFVTGLIVSEIPYLVICALVYYVCWYFTAGLPGAAQYAGSTFFVVFFYMLLYTGIGQMIAAYAPNAVFASLVNPLFITTLVSFCGVLVPYSQIQSFWRYWSVLPSYAWLWVNPQLLTFVPRLYYIDPFNYLMSSLLVFTTWDKKIFCKTSELAIFDPAPNQTCQQYLESYQQGAGIGTNLLNPDATAQCQVCQYTTGADFLRTLNLGEEYYGWRNAGIVVLFSMSSYMLVYLMMKLRTKSTKTAS
ncbi:multidrug resistance CDR2 protein [Curvularia clavata]|uniref:Multidrug resistance CDR2 protein n=1 Tax=Curvularia clavata TaxID=95742 RepID=A0A9Q9DRX9_CURCL|nr:multidrug resistance CDR2 protein [Curvularia clavata]